MKRGVNVISCHVKIQEFRVKDELYLIGAISQAVLWFS